MPRKAAPRTCVDVLHVSIARELKRVAPHERPPVAVDVHGEPAKDRVVGEEAWLVGHGSAPDSHFYPARKNSKHYTMLSYSLQARAGGRAVGDVPSGEHERTGRRRERI